MWDDSIQKCKMQDFPRPVCVIMEKFKVGKRRHCITDEDLIGGVESTEATVNRHIHTGFTSDSEGESDVDPPEHNGFHKLDLQLPGKIEHGMKATSSHSQPSEDDVIRKRKHVSVSDSPMDIVYGRPKGTRSG